MAGLSPLWKRLGKQLIETVVGQEVTLLDRLHKKRLSDSFVVVEEVVVPDSHSLFESSMDSTMNPPSSEALVSPASSPAKKNVKAELGREKPSSSSIRANTRGLWKRKIGLEIVVSLEGVMSRPDSSTTTSLPKWKRYFVLWTEVTGIRRIWHPGSPYTGWVWWSSREPTILCSSWLPCDHRPYAKTCRG